MSAQSPQEIHDALIQSRVIEHYKEALEHFPKNRIVICALQGSQNYSLDLPASDVDTKLIVTPTFREIALAKKPISTTHVRANDEHIDFKDIRLYAETFYKQNLNFLEILFTKYYVLNPIYRDEWMRLLQARESIAHMNPYRAVKSMKGIAMEKYHAMEHLYPSKIEVIKEYGYDGKQVHHLLRIEDFIKNFIDEKPYEQCLKPTPEKVSHLLDYKKQVIPLETARIEAEKSMNKITLMADTFCEKCGDCENEQIRELIEDVTYNIMRIAIQEELGQNKFIIKI